MAAIELCGEELNEEAATAEQEVSGLQQKLVVLSLKRQCLQLKVTIKQLREECARHPSPPAVDKKDSKAALLLRQRRLEAEIEAWRKQSPDNGLLAEGGHEELRRNIEELKVTLEHAREQQQTISKALQRDQQYLLETQRLTESLRKKVRDKEEEKAATASPSIQDMSRMKQLEEMMEKSEAEATNLRQEMDSFIRKHFSMVADMKDGPSLSSEDPHTSQRTASREWKKLTLGELIEKLLEQTLYSPQDPCVSLKKVHREHHLFLQRLGIVEQQGETHIRLTPYHL